MATLTPTLTLASTDALSDAISFSVTDTLSVLGDIKRISYAITTASQDILTASAYNKSYIFLQNKSSTASEIITIGKKSTDATASYNNDPTITIGSTANISFGMTVSGDGIPGGATVLSVTDTTTFELSASTTGGSKSSQTLTFGTEDFITLGAGEFAFLPWSGTENLDALSADGTPTLEVMIFEATA
tara:strand:- start:19 stop:582 length:564 start_codon:yes stop_codon:yes gene_type:complete